MCLWEAILQRQITLDFLEDNQAVCKICKSGGSTKLMHMPRAHRINAASVAEHFRKDEIRLWYTKTCDIVADIYTKRFEDPTAWVKALYMANIVLPSFWDAPDLKDYYVKVFGSGLPFKPGGLARPVVGHLAPPPEKKQAEARRQRRQGRKC